LQDPAIKPIEEKLEPKEISGEEQALPGSVPNNDGKHAIEMIENVVTPLLVAVHDHFRVAARLEGVTERFELAAELREVVDFAIENDPHRRLAVRHRLMSARQVDDRQPAEAEADRSVDMVSLVVGATVHERAIHPPQAVRVDRSEVAEVVFAANPTHRRQCSFAGTS